MASTPGETTPTSAERTPSTIVYRAITLRVDLRVLAAIGSALIIVGALLPWVTPVFEPFQRALRPTTTGSWPVVAIGAIAILILFFPRFRTARVSTGVATLGLVAGLLALNSALNTLALRDVVIGTQSITTLSGIGLGVYLTLAGSIIALLAGLAPHPIGGDVARAEIRLWQPSFAIFGSIFVLFVLGAIGLGVWLGGGGSNANITPTPASFNSGLLATPLINAQVNPLVSPEATEPSAGEPTATATGNFLPPTEVLPPTPTPTIGLIEVQSPTPTSTQVPPVAPTFTQTPTPTVTSTPSPSPTLLPSPLDTPTVTSTPTETVTPTETGTPTATSTP
jgi:hypothetical protein